MPEELSDTEQDPRLKIEEQYKSNISDVIGHYKWMATMAIIVLTVTAAAAMIPETRPQYEWFFIVGWGLLAACIYCNIFVINRLLTISGVWSTPKEMRSPEQVRQLQEQGPMNWYSRLQQYAFYAGVAVVLAGVIANLRS